MENEKRYLIVGLGNAEQQYAGTRHNYGFEVANAVAKALKATFTVDRLAYVARGSFKGREIVVIMPTTYMNLSGKAVKYWLSQENVALDHCLVVYDDIDLPLGVFKLKPKGGGGTHNGIGNIIETLGSTDIPRMRCGIGKDYAMGHQIDYVLGRFSSEEMKLVEPCVERAVSAVKSFVTVGMQRTMSQCNTKESEIAAKLEEEQAAAEPEEAEKGFFKKLGTLFKSE
ncbi:MAG: aminoacyl-tRNA hydrolase [Bacteroidales bacterium]|nr:aminoacyl-tRNA hydrolase [Bacteroidales bacterium]